MVGPIPLEGSYIGGIGVSMKRMLKHWSLPIPVVHLNTELRSRACGTRGRLRAGNVWKCVANFVHLSYSVLKVRPALVHYHTSRGLAFLKDMFFVAWVRHCLRRKTILHVRSSDSRSILMGRSPRLRRLQVQILQHCSDRFVFLSANVRDDFLAILGADPGGRFASRCRVIPNFTILRDAWRDHQVRETVNLFFIGNVGFEKGVREIVTAVDWLRGRTRVPLRAALAGQFSSELEGRVIRRMVDDMGLHDVVDFLGPISGDAKEAAFLGADIFVLPSYSEGIPQSMLEAMAYGLPVVVSNVGGIPEVVRERQEGFIVEPRDVGGLCLAVQELVDSVECRKRMGSAGRLRIASQYTVGEYMRRLQALYDSLLLMQAPRSAVPGQPLSH